MMATNTILLTQRKGQAKRFVLLRPLMVSSKAQIRASLPDRENDTLWISDDENMTSQLLKSVSWPTKRLGCALLLYKPPIEAMTAIQECFDPVAFGASGEFLPREELAEVLTAENRDELFIGGTVDRESQTVTLWRGSLASLIVPFSAFPTSRDGVSPDFDSVTVTDYGQTLRFGKYEAAADAVLYEFDPLYRRRKAKERRESEQTLGASIRRLRKQRGLRREDFKPLAAKTLARIEQGLVKSVHKKTLLTIARLLRVKPEEIVDY